jgi:hypothetical protein
MPISNDADDGTKWQANVRIGHFSTLGIDTVISSDVEMP